MRPPIGSIHVSRAIASIAYHATLELTASLALLKHLVDGLAQVLVKDHIRCRSELRWWNINIELYVVIEYNAHQIGDR
jgi:uncharacterized alkaline shock family protein YloU